MKKRKNNLILMLGVLLISISLGYAFLNQDLTINGTGKVTANNWSIYFDNLVPNQNNVALSTGDVAATISTTTLTDVTYTITLQKPGDFYEFTVDVVNDGSLDAMVSTVSNKLGGVEIDATHPLPNYLNYSVTYSDGVSIAPNHLLEAGDTETYKVRLEYKTDITANDLPTTNQSLTINFSVEYVQADDNATERPPLIQLPVGRTKDNLQTGDEICINGATQECFNFIRYDGTNNEDVVLLSKYNLKVGWNNDLDNSEYSEPYTSNDPGYGLQDSTMRGIVEIEENVVVSNGVVSFAPEPYWRDGEHPNYVLKSKYGNNYPVDVYDTDYVTAPDFSTTCEGLIECWGTPGYSIAYFVEQYKNTLLGSNYRAIIKDARLLTYSEATDSSIGCDANNESCPTNGFITNTSFWLGTAGNDDYINETGIFHIGSFGDFLLEVGSFNHAMFYGVRPVIVISKSNL